MVYFVLRPINWILGQPETTCRTRPDLEGQGWSGSRDDQMGSVALVTVESRIVVGTSARICRRRTIDWLRIARTKAGHVSSSLRNKLVVEVLRIVGTHGFFFKLESLWNTI